MSAHHSDLLDNNSRVSVPAPGSIDPNPRTTPAPCSHAKVSGSSSDDEDFLFNSPCASDAEFHDRTRKHHKTTPPPTEDIIFADEYDRIQKSLIKDEPPRRAPRHRYMIDADIAGPKKQTPRQQLMRTIVEEINANSGPEAENQKGWAQRMAQLYLKAYEIRDLMTKEEARSYTGPWHESTPLYDQWKHYNREKEIEEQKKWDEAFNALKARIEGLGK